MFLLQREISERGFMESLPEKEVVLPALYVIANLSKGVDINRLGAFPIQYLTEPRCKEAQRR